MQFDKQVNKKRFAITCSLVLCLLSFNLSAVIYKITDLSNNNVSFYFQSQARMNNLTVYLDKELLQLSGFQAEQVTIEPGTTDTSLIYRVSGGSSLSQQTDSSASSQELTRNLLPAFRMISSTLRHPEFRQAVNPEPEQNHRGMRIFYHVNGPNINLISDMDEVSRTANSLQTDRRISAWFPQLPYLKDEREYVIPVTVYQADTTPKCSSEATTSDCSSGQPFLHQGNILDAFGVPVGNQPEPLTLSERNNLLPSPQFDNIDQQVESQLHITTGARMSPEYATANREGRLSYHDPSLSKVIFLRVDYEDCTSIWFPPQHFIFRAEFDSTDDEDITVPDIVNMNAFYIWGYSGYTVSRVHLDLPIYGCTENITTKSSSQLHV
ncbi:hypothetical protein [Endozoicomonas sp. NE40]|uniref:Uncharacterized protein n=1 Tax=Endozoicomonas lisbonensis TaxID=3120522 RepID=A0ABV2SE55_9GAMM